MGITAAVRCSGPSTGSVRITVAHDQGVHAAGPIDRHALTANMTMTSAPRAFAVRQRYPQVFRRADLCVLFMSLCADA